MDTKFQGKIKNGMYLVILFAGISISAMLFFYHDFLHYVNSMLFRFFKKYGWRVESAQRKLLDADRDFSLKAVGIELKNEMRIYLDACVPNSNLRKKFRSQIIWLPIEWFSRTGSQGTGVINTPKKVIVYYLRSMPFIYQLALDLLIRSICYQRIIPIRLSIW